MSWSRSTPDQLFTQAVLADDDLDHDVLTPIDLFSAIGRCVVKENGGLTWIAHEKFIVPPDSSLLSTQDLLDNRLESSSNGGGGCFVANAMLSEEDGKPCM